ncbi:MAG: tRNA epoxyqueuosine(34) reductase QueG [Anaerolineae bacterium]|nr:tRNA epoxyqueuosine(34) reductase QueG [Anaerolineae bacterium]
MAMINGTGQRIIERAHRLGFELAGIAPAVASPTLDAYLRWIEAGYHGEMGYMARPDRVARRKDLNVILPGAKSLVVVGMNYYTGGVDQAVGNESRGRISNYAWEQDYHDVMLPKLEELGQFIEQEVAAGEVRTRAYVDTGAILERGHGEQAGLGFIGKNTMLINPRMGSFFFLGVAITTAELVDHQGIDKKQMPDCGTCTRCTDQCPTGAIIAPYVIDARRCISYLTIELKGSIPRELRPSMGRWVYGCDICQMVCPWQRFAEGTPQQETFAAADIDRALPPLPALLRLSAGEFEAMFRGSAIYRIKRERLVRNACVAAGNSEDRALGEYLIALLSDESPIVRGHAVWALGRLGIGQEALRKALAGEIDQGVREEISLVLEG